MLFQTFVAEDGEVELQGQASGVTRLHLLSLLNAFVVALEAPLDALLVPFSLTYLSNVAEIVTLQLLEIDDCFGVSVVLGAWHQMLGDQVEKVFADVDTLIL